MEAVTAVKLMSEPSKMLQLLKELNKLGFNVSFNPNPDATSKLRLEVTIHAKDAILLEEEKVAYTIWDIIRADMVKYKASFNNVVFKVDDDL